MPQHVAVTDILASPRAFDGCEVSASGIFMKFQENQCLEATSGEIDDIEFDVDECYRIWLETDEQTEWGGFTPRWGCICPQPCMVFIAMEHAAI